MNRNPDPSAASNGEDIPHDGAAFQRRVGDAAEPVAENGNNLQDRVLPQIEREVDDDIHVGAGGPLIVPREDIEAGIDVGEDLDLAAMQSKKIRKPHRREFVSLNAASELRTNLLLHKPKADGIETEYYYVSPSLRTPIKRELKPCRVYVFYSWLTKMHALWVVHVTPENSWYESLQTVLKQNSEFFVERAIRVMSDKEKSRYEVRHKAASGPVVWPTKSTSELLGEAIGPDKFITSAAHPLYRDLTDGVDLI